MLLKERAGERQFQAYIAVQIKSCECLRHRILLTSLNFDVKDLKRSPITTDPGNFAMNMFDSQTDHVQSVNQMHINH